jgi:3-hydroxyisobutyrate dehydrogenase
MKIGFIGLGIMGTPMARHLMAAGHELVLRDHSCKRCNQLRKEGARTAGSAASAAEEVAVLVVMVPDTPDVEDVLFGEEGAHLGLRPGAVVIVMSTISPKASIAFAERLAAQGVAMLDAPVSGGEPGAQEGTLSIMVGGEREVFERCLPLFECLGRTIVYTGPAGCGQKTKLVNQVVGALNLLAAVEGVRLAQASGLDLPTTIDAVGAGAAGSWMWSNLAPKIAAGDFAPGFMIRLQQKDLRLAREFFEDLSLDGPGTALAAKLFTQALEKGLGQEGNQGLYNLWR